MSLKSINPFNYKLNEEFQEYSGERLNTILLKSEESFKLWKETTFELRSTLFLACAKNLISQKQMLSEIITREMGKSLKEAVAEIEKCAKACEYYAANAESFLKDEIIKSTASRSYVSYEPLGCIFAIMPWNFPFWQVFRFAIPALMAGNVGLLKLASNVPQCTLAIEKIFKDSGFPEGVFQSVLLGSAKVADIISHKTVKAVTLTGSEKAGAEVATVAGKNIKKTVLELGGSDAFIVLDDADLDYASTMAVKSRMQNAGQSCIAAKRFIVVEKIFDLFLEKFKAKVAALKVGDPLDTNNDMGPMARKDLVESLLSQVHLSIEKGAKLIIGGQAELEKGAFISPGILIDVKAGMPAYEEELFGPIASVIKVKNEEEAIQIANDSRYGLGASIWTKNISKAAELARKIESGAVFINGIVASDPHLPFGGIKISGYGRELSYHGIREFVNVKTVWIA